MQQTVNDVDLPQQTNALYQSNSSSPTFYISDKSGSLHLHVLFQTALDDYENQTGMELNKHPLAEHLQDCNSVEAITTILREQMQGLNKFQEKDKSLEATQEGFDCIAYDFLRSLCCRFCSACWLDMSEGTDRVLNVSNPYYVASPACENNTHLPQNSSLCMHLSLVSECALCNI